MGRAGGFDIVDLLFPGVRFFRAKYSAGRKKLHRGMRSRLCPLGYWEFALVLLKSSAVVESGQSKNEGYKYHPYSFLLFVYLKVNLLAFPTFYELVTPFARLLFAAFGCMTFLADTKSFPTRIFCNETSRRPNLVCFHIPPPRLGAAAAAASIQCLTHGLKKRKTSKAVPRPSFSLPFNSFSTSRMWHFQVSKSSNFFPFLILSSLKSRESGFPPHQFILDEI